jgi:hypothetical protein
MPLTAGTVKVPVKVPIDGLVPMAIATLAELLVTAFPN